jgi:hypothetical protein
MHETERETRDGKNKKPVQVFMTLVVNNNISY